MRLVFAAALFAILARAAGADALPLLTIVKTDKPPVIDGKAEPGKWDGAAACTGFVRVSDQKLAHLQTVVFVTYDDKYLYVCVKNDRGKEQTFLKAAGRRPDDENIVYDFANEIWFSPPASPARTYQTLFNAYPGVLDQLKIPSLGYTSKSWTGRWEMASSQSRDGWIIEGRAPISAFGCDRIADGAAWKGLFCTDIISGADGFRAWAPGGAFEDIARHGALRFRSSGPVFQFLDAETIFSGKAKLRFGLTGSATVQARLGNIQVAKTLNTGGKHEEFSLEADLSTLAGKGGDCEITARTETGDVLYHQLFPFTVDGFVRESPKAILRSPYSTPFGVSAFYAPLHKDLVVKVDRYYMENKAASGELKVTDSRTKQLLASGPIAPFNYDYSESLVHLACKPGDYNVEVNLEGDSVSVPLKVADDRFEWLSNEIGVSDKVIPPWTPMKWEGDGLLSMWNKKYILNGLGLADEIVNSGAPQLSGPMRLLATIGGKEREVVPGKANLVKATDAAIQLSGSAPGFHVDTRVEFDGCVLNTMILGTSVDKLSLVITMPKSEATCFVTTSGGWSAYHGWTPKQWDSRESSSGSRRGNFVPYIFLTDSDRGFCWFADNDAGWILDPALPTQELFSNGATVTLKVNFITRPGGAAPATFQYGWMVTPQKPQPKSWRAYQLNFIKSYPRMPTIFFSDADGAKLWGYYSSPFPRDYAKSRELIEDSKSKGVMGFVGSVAHSIGRYQDYEGRQFDELAADWGETPGDKGDGNVARSRGPNEFELWNFNRWIEQSGLTGIYFDENYLAENRNYITGSAYFLPDGSIQPGYSYLGLREFDKRLRYMFHDHNIAPPSLFLHTTSGQPIYSWMPDIAMEGENVEPTGDEDYPAAYPSSRMLAIGRGSNLGCAPLVMAQADRHWNPVRGPFLIHQFVGWTLLHDAIPEQSALWSVLAPELEMWRDDIRFLPYWKPGLGVQTGDAEILASAHIAPRQGVVWVFNMARRDKRATIRLDLSRLGFNPEKTIAYDVETGAPVALKEGAFEVEIPARLWRAVRLRQPKFPGVTFTASFKEQACADEALGNPLPRGKDFPALAPAALLLEKPVTFETRHHLEAGGGSVRFEADIQGDGPLLTIGAVTLRRDGGKLRLSDGGKLNASAPLPAGVHAIKLGWSDGAASIQEDGREILRAPLPRGMPIPAMGRGSDIADSRRAIAPEGITFGPLKAAIRNLVMAQHE